MTRRRAVLWALAAIAGVNVALAALDALLGGPSGPPSSSYATSARGVAAWAELLERHGHRVAPVLDQADRVGLDPGATVVVLEPDALVAGEARALREFVERGGRLVAGGTDPERWLGDVVPDLPAWTPGAPRRWRVVPGALAGGAREVRSAGAGAWRGGVGWDPLVTAEGVPEPPALVVSRSAGLGEVVLLADASPVQNRLLGAADDAALALALAGRPERPVRFLEAVHGYGRGRGLGALPPRWRLALAGLALAALLLVAGRARRLGPPDPEPAPPPPARREHVDALATALARTRDRDWAAARLERARAGSSRR